MIRGVDSGSRKNVVEMFRFISVLKFIMVNEAMLIRKAWDVMLIHMKFFLENSSRGSIISDELQHRAPAASSRLKYGRSRDTAQDSDGNQITDLSQDVTEDGKG
ncbi:hypothetical protein NP202_23775 [Salmonella enterica]|nr:hypothetical protein [Salmonella enterica]